MARLFTKKEPAKLDFSSRADAFAYMLAYMIEERGAEPMEAAQKANDFADIFAKNLGLPMTTDPPVEGLDKYLQMADKVGKYCEEHPRVLEYLAGAVTFVAGVVAGKKAEDSAPLPPKTEAIDFNSID